MTTPLNRVRRGLIILGVVVALSVLGYRLLGYPWLEAVWIVVITISSVGFGERSQQPPAGQLLTIAVVIFGLTAAAYTFGGLLQLLLAGELELLLGRTLMTREINNLKNHTIVVGFGRIGRVLAADLKRQGRRLLSSSPTTNVAANPTGPLPFLAKSVGCTLSAAQWLVPL